VSKGILALMAPMATLRPAKEAKLSVKIPEDDELYPVLQEHFPKDIIALLIGFRVVNALSISTFFQPDEYFQALEPAWQIAFGSQSGAWITWVRWRLFP
jgi:phosphatidylinositol glycan class B